MKVTNLGGDSFIPIYVFSLNILLTTYLHGASDTLF